MGEIGSEAPSHTGRRKIETLNKLALVYKDKDLWFPFN